MLFSEKASDFEITTKSWGDEIKHVLTIIGIEADYTIAGGSVMGVIDPKHPFSDIDIFIKKETIKVSRLRSIFKDLGWSIDEALDKRYQEITEAIKVQKEEARQRQLLQQASAPVSIEAVVNHPALPFVEATLDSPLPQQMPIPVPVPPSLPFSRAEIERLLGDIQNDILNSFNNISTSVIRGQGTVLTPDDFLPSGAPRRGPADQSIDADISEDITVNLNSPHRYGNAVDLYPTYTTNPTEEVTISEREIPVVDWPRETIDNRIVVNFEPPDNYAYSSMVIEGIYNFELKGLKVQIVVVPDNRPSEILKTFDLSCCAVAFDGVKIWWLDDAVEHILEKKMRVLPTEQGAISFNPAARIEKYQKKGYTLI